MEDSVAPPIAAPDSRRATIVASPDAANWNVFEADVDVGIDGSDLARFNKRQVSRGVSYHLSRRRDQRGRWVTTQEFGDLIPRVKNSVPGLGPPPVVRAVDLGDGSPIAFFDASGRRLDVPKFSPPTPRYLGDARPRMLSGPLPRVPEAMPASSPETRSDTSSGWIDRFVISPDGVLRERERLARAFGAPSRQTPGLSRFTQTMGKHQTEITVNDATGLVEQVRMSSEGRLQSQVTREYLRRGDGVYVLRAERMSRFNEKGELSPQQALIRYRNVRILEER